MEVPPGVGGKAGKWRPKGGGGGQVVARVGGNTGKWRA